MDTYYPMGKNLAIIKPIDLWIPMVGHWTYRDLHLGISSAPPWQVGAGLWCVLVSEGAEHSVESAQHLQVESVAVASASRRRGKPWDGGDGEWWLVVVASGG